eukprot:gnl/TRDRNA2_/TRDRNA2_161760_c0_seq1.p1 gnl/TRDRNA2_/TRDRNA2_161760_c0~~gnl/TRDRNA2_/TRDRNA2_161760_c0_seq1.p1  ORF type:complete len:353 (-),score=42.61 gnl/TRDRNA2_/TRDRNA2_161760_c0_seq1:214-1272(-)
MVRTAPARSNKLSPADSWPSTPLYASKTIRARSVTPEIPPFPFAAPSDHRSRVRWPSTPPYSSKTIRASSATPEPACWRLRVVEPTDSESTPKLYKSDPRPHSSEATRDDLAASYSIDLVLATPQCNKHQLVDSHQFRSTGDPYKICQVMERVVAQQNSTSITLTDPVVHDMYDGDAGQVRSLELQVWTLQNQLVEKEMKLKYMQSADLQKVNGCGVRIIGPGNESSQYPSFVKGISSFAGPGSSSTSTSSTPPPPFWASGLQTGDGGGSHRKAWTGSPSSSTSAGTLDSWRSGPTHDAHMPSKPSPEEPPSSSFFSFDGCLQFVTDLTCLEGLEKLLDGFERSNAKKAAML